MLRCAIAFMPGLRALVRTCAGVDQGVAPANRNRCVVAQRELPHKSV